MANCPEKPEETQANSAEAQESAPFVFLAEHRDIRSLLSLEHQPGGGAGHGSGGRWSDTLHRLSLCA